MYSIKRLFLITQRLQERAKLLKKFNINVKKKRQVDIFWQRN